MSLTFVLIADGTLERLFLVFRPGFSRRFQAVAADRREYRGSLFAAHDADARVRPHPQETRLITAAAHGVIAGAEAAADDDGEFGHVGAGDRRDHLRSILGDAGLLVFLADHESGDVLQEDQRN